MSQRFGISPRFYPAYEADDNGDGYYEFKPMNGTGSISQMYSKVDKIQMNQGKYAGKFHIIYDDKNANASYPG